MVVCGLWHEARATFIVWGAYHGLLLVSHRIGQQVKRSLPFKWSPTLGLAMSSVSTFCLVSVGWLFFRAHTLTQAMQMSRALFAPGSYADLSLPRTFYATTSAIFLGWALYHAAEALMARWRAAREEGVEEGVLMAAQKPVTLDVVAIELLDFAAARMWWWLAPMTVVMALFVGLAIHDLRPAQPATPFMYTIF
jgi:alginate O-acetyltransferase complex protein AlgI